MTPSPMMKRASSFLALFLLALAVLATIPDRAHSVPQSPVILGWGGSRLVENTLYSNTTIPSIVFPFENASDQEVLARRIVEMGLNTIRISLAPYCTDPNGFMSPYNSTRLERAIRIGETLGMWIIVDYHGYEDVSNSTVGGCWLSFWRTVLTDFSSSYGRIIWEPLNEPMNLNGASLTGLPPLNTEGGPGPSQRPSTKGTAINCPVLVANGASGYCETNIHFIKTLTELLEAHAPQRINWVWWPAGDWSDTPGTALFGAVAPNAWGTLITWQPLPVHSLSISSTGGGSSFPHPGNYTYTSGTIVNVSAIPEDGYKLSEWQDNATSLPATDNLELSMSTDQNVVAIFSPIQHDVAVENVSLADRIVTPGRSTTMVVTVRNLGDVSETFNVTFYCDNASVASQVVQNLGVRNSLTVSFVWDTTGLRPGTYLLDVVASPVPGETDLANNNLTLAVNLPSHSGTNNPTASTTSLGSALYVGMAGFVALTLGATLVRRRLR